MYARVVSFIVALFFVTLAAATQTVTVTSYPPSTPTPLPANQCGTSGGTLHCCTFADDSSNSIIAAALALADVVVSPITALVGSACSAVSVGGTCSTNAVCCQNQVNSNATKTQSTIAHPLQCPEPNVRLCCKAIEETGSPVINNLFIVLKFTHDFARDGGVAARCKPMDMFGMGADGFCTTVPACCNPDGIKKDGELVLGCNKIDHFDENGRARPYPNGPCTRTAAECGFVHPNEPQWATAKMSNFNKRSNTRRRGTYDDDDDYDYDMRAPSPPPPQPRRPNASAAMLISQIQQETQASKAGAGAPSSSTPREDSMSNIPAASSSKLVTPSASSVSRPPLAISTSTRSVHSPASSSPVKAFTPINMTSAFNTSPSNQVASPATHTPVKPAAMLKPTPAPASTHASPASISTPATTAPAHPHSQSSTPVPTPKARPPPIIAPPPNSAFNNSFSGMSLGSPAFSPRASGGGQTTNTNTSTSTNMNTTSKPQAVDDDAMHVDQPLSSVSGSVAGVDAQQQQKQSSLPPGPPEPAPYQPPPPIPGVPDGLISRCVDIDSELRDIEKSIKDAQCFIAMDQKEKVDTSVNDYVSPMGAGMSPPTGGGVPPTPTPTSAGPATTTFGAPPPPPTATTTAAATGAAMPPPPPTPSTTSAGAGLGPATFPPLDLHDELSELTTRYQDLMKEKAEKEEELVALDSWPVGPDQVHMDDDVDSSEYKILIQNTVELKEM
ncbi:hypothetical protein CVT24_012688, partial [Panaeolus cyanescens]